MFYQLLVHGNQIDRYTTYTLVKIQFVSVQEDEKNQGMVHWATLVWVRWSNISPKPKQIIARYSRLALFISLFELTFKGVSKFSGESIPNQLVTGTLSFVHSHQKLVLVSDMWPRKTINIWPHQFNLIDFVLHFGPIVGNHSICLQTLKSWVKGDSKLLTSQTLAYHREHFVLVKNQPLLQLQHIPPAGPLIVALSKSVKSLSKTIYLEVSMVPTAGFFKGAQNIQNIFLEVPTVPALGFFHVFSREQSAKLKETQSIFAGFQGHQHWLVDQEEFLHRRAAQPEVVVSLQIWRSWSRGCLVW